MITAEVVLFDLGNTLFYDRAAAWPRIYKRAEAALWRGLRREAGIQIPTGLYGEHDTLLSFYYALRGTGIQEPGTFQVLKDLLARHNVSASDASVAHALRAMYAVTQSNWRVERDAVPTLRRLLDRGFHLGAVSNGSDDQNALEILGKAKMRNYFELVLTSAAHGRRKPEASIFEAALNHFGVTARNAVMIGDSYEADILGAHALGMPTIWITRRAGPPPPAPAVLPDATVGALLEIPGILA